MIEENQTSFNIYKKHYYSRLDMSTGSQGHQVDPHNSQEHPVEFIHQCLQGKFKKQGSVASNTRQPYPTKGKQKKQASDNPPAQKPEPKKRGSLYKQVLQGANFSQARIHK